MNYEAFVLGCCHLPSEVMNTTKTMGDEPQGHKNNFSLGVPRFKIFNYHLTVMVFSIASFYYFCVFIGALIYN